MDCIRCGAQFDVFEGSCPTCNWNPDDVLDELAGLRVGEKIQDRYEVKESLGAGRFGVAISVMDKKKNNRVVMKFFHPALLPDPKLIDRFMNGIGKLSKASSPLITDLLDFGVDESYRCFMVQEKARGTTLRTLIKKRWNEGRVFTLPEVMSILEKITPVYDDVPTFVHGSLSPKRIWLDSEDLFGAGLMLSGAGIVCNLPPQVVWHRMRALLASRGYAPPELLMGRRPDQFSDVFGAGVMVAEMLTGVAFDGQIEIYLESTPPLETDIYAIVKRALNALPNRRYRNLSSMLEALRETEFSTDALKKAPASKRDTNKRATKPGSAVPKMDKQATKTGKSPADTPFNPEADETDLFDNTVQVSMKEVILAHVEYGGSRSSKSKAQSVKSHSDDTGSNNSKESSQPLIEPVRPTARAGMPSYVPPPPKQRADDPQPLLVGDSDPKGPATLPYAVGKKPRAEDREDTTEELNLSDAEIIADDDMDSESTDDGGTRSIDEATGELEQQALEAERRSTDELLRRAGRLDGVDPRLVRAAHALESERLRDKSIYAANLIREKADDLDGIDPRLLRAAAKLGAKENDDTKTPVNSMKSSQIKKDDGEEESTDGVISFVSPPASNGSANVSGFPPNRKQAGPPEKKTPPAPGKSK